MRIKPVLVLAAVLTVCSCAKEEEEALTLGEAAQALEEVALSSRAMTFTSSAIEITTDFTIGGALADVAAEIGVFIEATLPCAQIDVVDNELTVVYGAKPGECTYKGQTYSGTHKVKVTKNSTTEAVVEHQWIEFQNQQLSVDGWSTVTWNWDNSLTRQVQHELTWTRKLDDRQGVGSGDRLQQGLDGNWLEGMQVDGTRAWDGKAGHWDLAINSVQMRWIDPVPQSGSYVLDTPFEKSATFAFQRVDEDTIQVSISSGENEFTFNVTKAGTISEQ